MFYPEKIISIKENDKVLEIGPGGSPHPRSDVFLDKRFEEKEAFEQRGKTNNTNLSKPIFYYEGVKFPFKDKEFDYVICSHVIEHVENVDLFIEEMLRVGKSGYMEYPTIYYEYLFNFEVHQNFIKKQKNILYWTPKKNTPLFYFKNIQNFFYKKLLNGQEKSIINFKEINFEGFEWKDTLITQKTSSVELLTFTDEEIEFFFNNKLKDKKKGIIFELLISIKNKFKKIF